MKTVLDAAVRAGHVVSKGPVRFWVTEFSWDSDPPDPGGIPASLEGRWVAEALYQHVVCRREPRHLVHPPRPALPRPARTSPASTTSGPRSRSDRPKPALTAFRFPFVAFLHGSRIAVWGRTPAGRRGTVRVEQHVPAGWTHVATLRANAVGIFAASLEAHGRGPLRAEYPADGTSSLPFSLEVPLDHPYQPFGAPLPTTAALLGGPASSAVSQYVEVAPGAGGSPGAGGTGGAAAGAAPALTGARADAVPGSALAAGVDAIGSVGGRALVFGAVLIALTVLVCGTAVGGRRSEPPRAGLGRRGSPRP